ncbi:MAG: hypothetical protein V8Q75_06400 [Bacilli bacterium]
MDYEQEYYNLLYENRKLKNEVDILGNELCLIKNNKRYMAITLTFVKKINELNRIVNKLYIYNSKIAKKTRSKQLKDYALNNLKIMEVQNEKST